MNAENADLFLNQRGQRLSASKKVSDLQRRFPCPSTLPTKNKTKRWVVRALHRNAHLNEADAALKS